MFDVIGGVRVSAVEYLLMGAALVLFFVLLLAFAEVIGFTPAYIVASAAIAGLNTAYSAAVLGSWRRAAFIGGLLDRPLCGALHPAQPRGLLAADRLAAALRGARRRDVCDTADRLGSAEGGGHVTLRNFAASRHAMTSQAVPPKRIFPIVQGRCSRRRARTVDPADRERGLQARVPGQRVPASRGSASGPLPARAAEARAAAQRGEHRLDVRLLRFGPHSRARKWRMP